MNGELGDCDDIGRFVMPQGRFTPIFERNPQDRGFGLSYT